MPTSYASLVQTYMKRGMSQADAEIKARRRYAGQHGGKMPETYIAIINNLMEKREWPDAADYEKAWHNLGITPSGVAHRANWKAGNELEKRRKAGKSNTLTQEGPIYGALHRLAINAEKKQGEINRLAVDVAAERYFGPRKKQGESLERSANILEGFFSNAFGKAREILGGSKLNKKAAAADTRHSTRQQQTLQNTGFTSARSLQDVDVPAVIRKTAMAPTLSPKERSVGQKVGVIPPNKPSGEPYRPFAKSPKGGFYSPDTGLHTRSGRTLQPSPGQEPQAKELQGVKSRVQTQLDRAEMVKRERDTFHAKVNSLKKPTLGKYVTKEMSAFAKPITRESLEKAASILQEVNFEKAYKQHGILPIALSRLAGQKSEKAFNDAEAHQIGIEQVTKLDPRNTSDRFLNRMKAKHQALSSAGSALADLSHEAKVRHKMGDSILDKCLNILAEKKEANIFFGGLAPGMKKTTQMIFKQSSAANAPHRKNREKNPSLEPFSQRAQDVLKRWSQEDLPLAKQELIDPVDKQQAGTVAGRIRNLWINREGINRQHFEKAKAAGRTPEEQAVVNAKKGK